MIEVFLGEISRYISVDAAGRQPNLSTCSRDKKDSCSNTTRVSSSRSMHHHHIRAVSYKLHFFIMALLPTTQVVVEDIVSGTLKLHIEKGVNCFEP